MKINIINPNTTQSMTEKIAASANIVANSDTQIIAVSPQMGPATIESYYDEALSAVGVLEEIRQGEQQNVDAYISAAGYPVRWMDEPGSVFTSTSNGWHMST